MPHFLFSMPRLCWASINMNPLKFVIIIHHILCVCLLLMCVFRLLFEAWVVSQKGQLILILKCIDFLCTLSADKEENITVHLSHGYFTPLCLLSMWFFRAVGWVYSASQSSQVYLMPMCFVSLCWFNPVLLLDLNSHQSQLNCFILWIALSCTRNASGLDKSCPHVSQGYFLFS